MSKPDGVSRLSDVATEVLRARYLLKDERGEVAETPDEMFRRVARHVAKTPEDEEAYFLAMRRLEFLPNSPTLMNAGTPVGALSACYVLPVGDSISEIFGAVKMMAEVFQSGGGVGMSFSRLRQKGARVRTSGGESSGPISFMKLYNDVSDTVRQGGRRRGATMGMLRVDHPDVLEFVRCKREPGAFECFNLSVLVTDEFMRAAAEGREHDLIAPHTGEVVRTMPARELWSEVVREAWRTGEPGVAWIDRINAANPTPWLGEIESSNACGEIPLLPYESCNLGAINLAATLTPVPDGKLTSSGRRFLLDVGELDRVAKLGVRFLDDVIDANRHVLPEIEKATKLTRKIGLGVMGLAEMLAMLGVPYGSEEARQTGGGVMGTIRAAALSESRALARERGPFPALEGAPDSYKLRPDPPRNAALTVVAPTGSTSMIAGVTGGIEPMFAVGLRRRGILDGRELLQVNPALEAEMRRRGLWGEDVARAVCEARSLREVDAVPDDLKEVFVTAHEVSPDQHVRMQAAFQEHVDSAISKTVNLPRDATEEDVAGVFSLAWELGCKSVTVYRDGSREGQPLSSAAAGPEKKATAKPPPRPEVLPGRTWKLRTGCGSIFVTITRNGDGRPQEVFAKAGKAGVCQQAQCESIGRLASLALRGGLDREAVAHQLAGVTCHGRTGLGPSRILSCADAVATALRRDEEVEGGRAPAPAASGAGHADGAPGPGACPDCGAALVHQEGCARCRACGYERCT